MTTRQEALDVLFCITDHMCNNRKLGELLEKDKEVFTAAETLAELLQSRLYRKKEVNDAEVCNTQRSEN